MRVMCSCYFLLSLILKMVDNVVKVTEVYACS